MVLTQMITILLFQHQAAVKDYVDTNGGDGLLIRRASTSGSTTLDTSSTNITGRTYYASKIVIKISTAFSGGSFNPFVKENGGTRYYCSGR